jgi:hypothetical protein
MRDTRKQPIPPPLRIISILVFYLLPEIQHISFRFMNVILIEVKAA